MRFALIDFLLSLLVISAILFLASLALPSELPCPMRLPTPMFSTDDCDCDGCCCAPVCKCVGLSYDVALKKAEREARPIVVFLNTKVHPVEGAVVCGVKTFPGVAFNVGVIVGVPVSWEKPGGTGHRELVSLYGPRSSKHIGEFINDHKTRLRKPVFVAPAPLAPVRTDCGPTG